MWNSTQPSYNHPKYYSFKSMRFSDEVTTNNRNIHVMMIDDSKKDINLVKEILKTECRANFTFSSYTDAHEALKHLERKEKPDIIILDLVMPSMNGKMVLQRLKGLLQTKEIPVVIHSSMSNYKNISHVNQLDAHAFFEKPLDGESFENFLFNRS